MSRSRRTRPLARGTWAVLAIAAFTAVVVAIGAVRDGRSGVPPGAPPSATGAVTPRTDASSSGNAILAGITITSQRQRAPQPYRRAAFGKAWTDDQSAPLGHNGCDTRNDILGRDLRDTTRTHVSSCPTAIATGTLTDPYSGGTIRFHRGRATSAKVQIDHIIALAYAWDMGAWSWDDAKRVRFANDPRNLIAVDGPANENKRDSPPGRWMPSNERFHCQYVRQFADIAREYGVAIERATAAVIQRASATC